MAGKKINFENARERIGAMVNTLPKSDELFMVTEKQFDELVARIMSESTKAFAEALQKQTVKHTVAFYDARIATYRQSFGFFRFI